MEENPYRSPELPLQATSVTPGVLRGGRIGALLGSVIGCFLAVIVAIAAEQYSPFPLTLDNTRFHLVGDIIGVALGPALVAVLGARLQGRLSRARE